MSEELSPYEKKGLPNASDLYELQKYLWNYKTENDRPRLTILSPIQDNYGRFRVLAVVSHLDYDYPDFLYEELSYNPTTKQYYWMTQDLKTKVHTCPPIDHSDYEDWITEQENNGDKDYAKLIESEFEYEVVHLYIAWSVLNFFEKIGNTQNP